MSIRLGQKSVGFALGSGILTEPALPPVGQADDVRQTIDLILSKMRDMETLIEGKADANRLRTLIKYSDEGILIQAEDIALVGNVTFAAVEKARNGGGGNIDPRITRIIGDVIQTGAIRSNNWGPDEGTALDLDNETLTLGGSAAPKLYYDGAGNLSISGTLTAGTIITDKAVIEGHPSGPIDLGALIDLAEETITMEDIEDMLGDESASILVNSENFLVMENSSNQASVTVGSAGIVATNASGQATFTLNALTGAATFRGDITGASGSFSGSLSGATGTFSGNLSAAGGTFAGNLSAASGTFVGDLVTSGQVYASGITHADGHQAAIVGYSSTPGRHGGYFVSNNECGILASSVGGIGVLAFSPAGVAMEAETGFSSQTALKITTGKIAKPRTSGHRLTVWDQATGTLVGEFEYRFD